MLFIRTEEYDLTLNIDNTYFFTLSSLSNENFEIDESLKVYPNPTNNLWNFVIENKKIESINIYNIEGKLLFSQTNSNNNFQVDSSSFSSGVYIANLIIDGMLKKVKLIKL